ncbi:MAG: hypothetical protein H0W02_04385 [Ktedonobacteraceae bacterium]|nr:hypothetical protein [Ktedonobacteraceae bacterium]
MYDESRFRPPRLPEITQEHAISQASRRTGRSPLAWWYRHTTSEESERDIIPRGQLASLMLLLTLVVSIAFIPAALTSDNMHVVPPVIVLFVVTFIGIVLNRRGKTTYVGILLVVAVDAALVYTLLTYTHFVLPQNAVPIYDMFVLSDIIAVSLLPIRSIFFVSLLHSIFMCADIALQPHTPDLQLLVDQTAYSFMVRPLTIQIVVALITYLWVRTTIKAVQRANKAELIADLERTIAQQKRELDEGVQQLLYTLVRAANGDLQVRAPLAQEHALWQVDIALNTLLARLQRANVSEIELQRIRAELGRLIYMAREAKGKRTMLWFRGSGTELDPLMGELQGCYIIQSPTGPQRM